MSAPEVGKAVESDITRLVCLKCGGMIDCGLCSYGCDNDATVVEERPKGSVVKRQYHRVEILVSEEDV